MKNNNNRQFFTLSACILAAVCSISSAAAVSMQPVHAAGSSTASLQPVHAAGCSTASLQPVHAADCRYGSVQTALSAQVHPADLDIPDSGDLFAGYVDQVFYGSRNTASLKGFHAASKLKGQNKTIYNFLKAEITKVADGSRTSTEFSIAVSSLLDKMSYSAAELGLNARSSKEEIADAIGNKIFDFSLYTVMNALFADCPYELYWQSRTASTIQSGPAYMLDAENGISFKDDASIIFQFPVDSPYAAGTYTTDASKTQAASNAAANAKAITAAAAGMSDYEKLTYYRQQICSLASYNDAAAAGNVSDTRPWQMIYVFDGNPSTNVVCEGYAKAFQYLCDMTTFSNANIYCITADGTMIGSRGSGPHMWNIVHMGSIGNYLVDVTNCDTGSIGAEDKLFLTGCASGSIQGGYTINIPGETRTEGSQIFTKPDDSVRYQYHDDMYSLYTSDELTLAQGGTLRPELVNDTEPHSHAYEADFAWSEDSSRCSVSIICRTNPAHSVSSLPCSVTSQILAPATCCAKGTTAYTARASYEGSEFSDTIKRQDIAINPSNHTGQTLIRNASAASSTQNGYTGDTYCQDCGALISKGSIIPASGKPDSSGQNGGSSNDPDSNGQNGGNANGSGSNGQNNGSSGSDSSGQNGSSSGSDSSGQNGGNTDSGSGQNGGSSNDPDSNGQNGGTPDDIPDTSENSAEILDTISAKKASATLKKGQSIRFRFGSSLNMEEVKKITYKTSKKSVAKVSKNGKITGKKKGNATIKAKVTLKNGMTKTVSMKIRVKAKK